MSTKHFENETFQIFRKIVDVDTCQESDISLKTSVAYRLVNSDPRGPNRTYYVSLLNIRKNEVYFEIHFSVIGYRTVRDGPWMAGWKTKPRFKRFQSVQFGSVRHSRIKLFSLVRLSQVFFCLVEHFLSFVISEAGNDFDAILVFQIIQVFKAGAP